MEIHMRNIYLFICILFFSLIFLNSTGAGDIETWRRWLENSINLGYIKGYKSNIADYPPLASSIAYFFHLLTVDFSDNLYFSIKFAIFFFLLLTTVAYGYFARNALSAMLLYVLLFPSSMLLAYTDIFFAPFVIGALWAIKREKYIVFSILFSLACLIKWQPIIILPFFIFYLLRVNVKRRSELNLAYFFIGSMPGLLLFSVVVFMFNEQVVWESFQRALSHNYLSANALNFNWILTYYVEFMDAGKYAPLHEGLAHWILLSDDDLVVGKMLFRIGYFALLMVFLLRDRDVRELILFSLIGYLLYFVFNVGVHENHLFLSVILASFLVLENKKYDHIYMYVGFMSNINLIIFYGFMGKGPGVSRLFFGLDVSVLLSFLNTIFVLVLFACLIFREYKNLHKLSNDLVRH
jgi:Gpi18-like mannosyltransferase